MAEDQNRMAGEGAAKSGIFEACVNASQEVLYNAVELEQRIGLRPGQRQKSDVLLSNLLCKENFSDVRILELINKRVMQFDGIFGRSAPIVGNFEVELDEVLAQVRKNDEVEAVFEQNLASHEGKNKRFVSHAEDRLFTIFTKEVADKATITPKYIEKISEINVDLWNTIHLWVIGKSEIHCCCKREGRFGKWMNFLSLFQMLATISMLFALFVNSTESHLFNFESQGGLNRSFVSVIC